MTCSLVRSLLDAYADRELPVNTEPALKEHLELCPDCRAEFEQLLSLKAALSGYTGPEPAPQYWGEVKELILARTVEAAPPMPIGSDADRRSADRASLYRSILALAASLAIFGTSLWLGSSGPSALPALSQQDAEQPVMVRSGTSTVSVDEEELIASSMMLVGTPGMFASPAEMSGLLGLDRIR